MEENIKMAETVMLIDAAFLNLVTKDLKKNFEGMLGRELQDMDLSHLITYIALDAGMGEGKNDIQVLFIYDEHCASLAHAYPTKLKEELHDMAFNSEFGEFSFFCFEPEKMATREELYLESLKVIQDSKDVKRMIVLSFNEEYGDEVDAILKKVKDKKMIQFRMNEPEATVDYRWEMLAYPIMQALGIRGDELD